MERFTCELDANTAASRLWVKLQAVVANSPSPYPEERVDAARTLIQRIWELTSWNLTALNGHARRKPGCYDV